MYFFQVFSTEGLTIPITSVATVIPISPRLYNSTSSLKSLPNVNTNKNHLPISHAGTDLPSLLCSNINVSLGENPNTGDTYITDPITEPSVRNKPSITSNIPFILNLSFHGATEPSLLNLDLKSLQEISIPYNRNPNNSAINNVDSSIKNSVVRSPPPIVGIVKPIPRNSRKNMKDISAPLFEKDSFRSVLISSNTHLPLQPFSTTQLPPVIIDGKSKNPLDLSSTNDYLTSYESSPLTANIVLTSFTSPPIKQFLSLPSDCKTIEASFNIVPISCKKSWTDDPNNSELTEESQHDINNSLVTKNQAVYATPLTYYSAPSSSGLPMVSLPNTKDNFKTVPKANSMPSCLCLTPSSVIPTPSMSSITISNSYNSIPLPNRISCNTGPSAIKQPIQECMGYNLVSSIPFSQNTLITSTKPLESLTFNKMPKVTDFKLSSPPMVGIVKPIPKNSLPNVNITTKALRSASIAPTSSCSNVSLNILPDTFKKGISSPPLVPYCKLESLSISTLQDPLKTYINISRNTLGKLSVASAGLPLTKNIVVPINSISDTPLFTVPSTKINSLNANFETCAPKFSITESPLKRISCGNNTPVHHVCPIVLSFDSILNISSVTTCSKSYLNLDSAQLSNAVPTNTSSISWPSIRSVPSPLSSISLPTNNNLAKKQSIPYSLSSQLILTPSDLSTLSSTTPTVQPFTNNVFPTFATYNNEPIEPFQSYLISITAANVNDQFNLLNLRPIINTPLSLQSTPLVDAIKPFSKKVATSSTRNSSTSSFCDVGIKLPIIGKDELSTKRNCHQSSKYSNPLITLPFSTPPALPPSVSSTFDPLIMTPTSNITVSNVLPNSYLVSPNILPKVQSFPIISQKPNSAPLPQVSIPTTTVNSLSLVTSKPLQRTSPESPNLPAATNYLSSTKIQDSLNLKPISSTWFLPRKDLSISPTSLPDVSITHYYPNPIQYNAVPINFHKNSCHRMSQYSSLEKPIDKLVSNISTLDNSYQLDSTFNCSVAPLQISSAVILTNPKLKPLLDLSSFTLRCTPKLTQNLCSSTLPIPHFSSVSTNSLDDSCRSLKLDPTICTSDKPTIMPSFAVKPVTTINTIPKSSKPQNMFTNTQILPISLPKIPYSNNLPSSKTLNVLETLNQLPVDTNLITHSHDLDMRNAPAQFSAVKPFVSNTFIPQYNAPFYNKAPVPTADPFGSILPSLNERNLSGFSPVDLPVELLNKKSAPFDASHSSFHDFISVPTLSNTLPISSTIPNTLPCTNFNRNSSPSYNSAIYFDTHSNTINPFTGMDYHLPIVTPCYDTVNFQSKTRGSSNENILTLLPQSPPLKSRPNFNPPKTVPKPSSLTYININSNPTTSSLTNSLNSITSLLTKSILTSVLPRCTRQITPTKLPSVNTSKTTLLTNPHTKSAPTDAKYLSLIPFSNYNQIKPSTADCSLYNLPVKETNSEPLYLAPLPVLPLPLTPAVPKCTDDTVTTPVISVASYNLPIMKPSHLPLTSTISLPSAPSVPKKSIDHILPSSPPLITSTVCPSVEFTNNLPELSDFNSSPSISLLDTLHNNILSPLLYSKTNIPTSYESNTNLDKQLLQSLNMFTSNTDSRNTLDSLSDTVFSNTMATMPDDLSSSYLSKDFLPLINDLQTSFDNVPSTSTLNEFTPLSNSQTYPSFISPSTLCSSNYEESCCNLDKVSSLLPSSELAPVINSESYVCANTMSESVYSNVTLSLLSSLFSSDFANLDLGTSSSTSFNINSILDPSNSDKNSLKNVLRLIILSKLIGNEKNCDLLESYINGNLLT